jgi:hypothetical protein
MEGIMSKKKAAPPVIAFKGFNPDWTCNGFQYEVGETYKHEGEAKRYHGTLTEDCKAVETAALASISKAPSLNTLFSDFNATFSAIAESSGPCAHRWETNAIGVSGYGMNGERFDNRVYKCERCGEVR